MCSIFQLLLSVLFLMHPFLSKGHILVILFSDSPGKKSETQEISSQTKVSQFPAFQIMANQLLKGLVKILGCYLHMPDRLICDHN